MSTYRSIRPTDDSEVASAVPAAPLAPPDLPEMIRAPAGGIVGVNGEFYEGGKFLPSRADRPKQAPPPRLAAGRREEIEFRVWAAAPADWHRSIYAQIKEFAWIQGGHAEFRRGRSTPEWYTGYLESMRSGGYCGSTDGAKWMAELQGLMDAFNRGDRWTLSSEAPAGTRLVQVSPT